MRRLDERIQVIIIDDDEISVSIIESALCETCSTTSLAEPEKSLEYCIEIQPSIIILDREVSKKMGVMSLRG